MTYRFLTGARADLDAAIARYEARQAGMGDDFLAEVSAAVQRLLSLPQAAPKVAGCPRGRDVRVTMPHRFDYLIVYEVAADEVLIVSVTYARAGRSTWRRRLPDPEVPDE